MSTEIALKAINLNGLMLDGEHISSRDISYSKEWLDKVMAQNQDERAEGRLIIGCSWDACAILMRAVSEAKRKGVEVFVTDEEHIFADPVLLLALLLGIWERWHFEDPRWVWSQNTITEFFGLYQWAIIYIEVC